MRLSDQETVEGLEDPKSGSDLPEADQESVGVLSEITDQDNKNFYKIPVDGEEHILPSCYFQGFEKTFRVVRTAELKTTENTEIKNLREKSFIFAAPEGTSVVRTFEPKLYRKTTGAGRELSSGLSLQLFKPKLKLQSHDVSASFIGDLRRILRIVFLSNTGEQTLLFKPEDALNLSDDDLLNTVFDAILVHLTQFPREKFTTLGSTYYQAVLYFINNIIQHAFDPKFLTKDFQCQTDLVFDANGKINLDLYQVTYRLVSDKYQVNFLPLNVACTANVMVRLPFDEQKSAFAKPVIICDSAFLPFLYSNKEISLEKEVAVDESAQDSLRKALETSLQERSEGASSVKRSRMGKNALQFIGAATLIFLGVASFLAFGPVGPAVIGVIGGTLGTTAAAATAVTIGVGAVGGTGLSLAGYLVFRGSLGARNIQELKFSDFLIKPAEKEFFIIPSDEEACDLEESPSLEC